MLVARLDNLGKGASGAAVRNLSLMPGADERCSGGYGRWVRGIVDSSSQKGSVSTKAGRLQLGQHVGAELPKAFPVSPCFLRTPATALREAERWDDCPVVGPAALLAAPGAEDVSEAAADLAGISTSERPAPWPGSPSPLAP